MKKLVAPALAAFLFFNSGGGYMPSSNSYERKETPITESVDRFADYKGSVAHAMPLKAVDFPEMIVGQTINERAVEYYNFDIKYVDLGVKIERKPASAGYYMQSLEKEFGSELEFITTAGFYCMKNKSSVGRVIIDGHIEARGTYDGGKYIVYKDGKLGVEKNVKAKEISEGEWAHGGFASLVSSGELDLEETKKRNIGYNANRPRCALVVYSDGNAGLAYYDGSVGSMAHGLKAHGVKEAVMLDGGNSVFFAKRDHDSGNLDLVKREDNTRDIKSVIYGVMRS